jgi:UDP-N-acetylglucosamine 4,6-dehydratase/5-epimerase
MLLSGKSVLITGGTGSFGRAFVERVLRDYPGVHRLIVFSRDELKQYEMQQEFPVSRYPCMRYFIGDVRDLQRLELAMRKVDVVIHAAALKQVPAAEYNPMECVKTNVMGGQNVIDACLLNGVRTVVALSTDKAASPINLYGATKLVSDKLFVSANQLAGDRDIRFSVVRYGNVAGSRGSVIPFFRKVMEEGKTELPVTDARMTRFSIMLEEGVDFVIKSLHRMQGGETFVPKIPSFRVTDLARVMAPGLAVRYVGIRPGEKLHEIMIPRDCSHECLEFGDHYVIKPSIHWARRSEFQRNAQGEVGRAVADDFEYNSLTNERYLTDDELRALVRRV